MINFFIWLRINMSSTMRISKSDRWWRCLKRYVQGPIEIRVPERVTFNETCDSSRGLECLTDRAITATPYAHNSREDQPEKKSISTVHVYPLGLLQYFVYSPGWGCRADEGVAGKKKERNPQRQKKSIVTMRQSITPQWWWWANGRQSDCWQLPRIQTRQLIFQQKDSQNELDNGNALV